MATKIKSLQLSPSQIDSYLSCPRKWWMKSVLKLPEPPRKATTLGDVGHAVLGRFLEGKELYPKGWEQSVNRWTGKPNGPRLTTGEQSLVQALIHNGITEGTVLIEPDGIVEQEIELSLDIESPFEEGVKIKMFLDYATQHSVQDHKFCGSTRYYGKDKLATAVPMLLYAYAQWTTGNCKDDTIWLRYNLFVKKEDDPTTKTVEVEVTKAFVLNWFETFIIPTCKDMVALYLREVPEDEWFGVQGSEDRKDACTAYGGCPFLPVCSGQMSVEAYREAQSPKDAENIRKKEDAVLEGLRQATNNTTGIAGNKKEEEKKMAVPNFREQLLAKRKAAVSGAAEAPPPETKPEETPQAPGNSQGTATKPPAAAAAAAAPATGEPLVAPWFNPKCPASHGDIKGFTAKGTPCTVCNALNKRAGLRQANSYVIQTEEDGSLLVIDPETGDLLLDSKGPEVRTATAAIKPVEEPVKEEPVEEKAPDTPPATAAEPEPVSEDTSEEVVPPVAEAPKRKCRTKEEIAADEAAEPAAGQEPDGDDPDAYADLDPKDVRETYVQDRTGFTLSYAAVRQKKRVSRKLGDANCVVHIGELVETIAPHLLEAHKAAGGKAASYYEIGPFARHDLIAANAQVIAQVIGNSILEADTVQRATDEAHVCAAVERYAVLVFGEMV